MQNVGKCSKRFMYRRNEKVSGGEVAAAVTELKAMKLPEDAKKVADGIEELLPLLQNTKQVV